MDKFETIINDMMPKNIRDYVELEHHIEKSLKQAANACGGSYRKKITKDPVAFNDSGDAMYEWYDSIIRESRQWSGRMYDSFGILVDEDYNKYDWIVYDRFGRPALCGDYNWDGTALHDLTEYTLSYDGTEAVVAVVGARLKYCVHQKCPYNHLGYFVASVENPGNELGCRFLEDTALDLLDVDKQSDAILYKKRHAIIKKYFLEPNDDFVRNEQYKTEGDDSDE
jgi:hypothetical protein